VATTSHKAYTAAIASVLTTELNSIANAAISAASSAIDNTSALDLYCDLTFTIATQGGARSTGATVTVKMVQALDGTNYDDVEVTCGQTIAVFPLDAATTARQVSARDIPVPPGLYKLFVLNSTGQAFASSGNILEHRFHSITTA
jgi:hypothetical protein